MKSYLIICILFLFSLFSSSSFASQSVTCGCYTGSIADNIDVTACNIYPNVACRDQAVSDAYPSTWPYYCTAPGTLSRFCYDFLTNGAYPAGLYVYCPDDCIDLDNDCQCDPADCSDEEAEAAAQCTDGVYQITDAEQCTWACCDVAAATAACGETQTVTWGADCTYTCTDPDAACAEQVKDAAEAACGDGTNGTGGYYVSSDPCGYQCKTCTDLQKECYEGCAGGNAIHSCSSSNGVYGNSCVCPDDDYNPPGDDSGDGGTTPPAPDKDNPDPPNPDDPYIPKTCDDAQAKCNPACSFVCNESNPASSACDCSTNPDPNPDDTPDPTDPEDTNKWLEGIKGQLDEANGWLEKIADNTDTSLDLDKDRNDDLDNIAENTRRSVDNQGKLLESLEQGNKLTNAQNKVFGEMNSKLSEIKDDSHEVKVDVSEIKTGLSDAHMTAEVDDVPGLSGDEVTGDGYTTAANPSETTLLPSSESLDTHFGNVDTTETAPYITDAIDRLSHIGVELSAVDCSYIIPLQGLDDIHLNFCPYADYFSKIGSLLVMLVALRELLTLY